MQSDAQSPLQHAIRNKSTKEKKLRAIAIREDQERIKSGVFRIFWFLKLYEKLIK